MRKNQDNSAVAVETVAAVQLRIADIVSSEGGLHTVTSLRMQGAPPEMCVEFAGLAALSTLRVDSVLRGAPAPAGPLIASAGTWPSHAAEPLAGSVHRRLTDMYHREVDTVGSAALVVPSAGHGGEFDRLPRRRVDGTQREMNPGIATP